MFVKKNIKDNVCGQNEGFNDIKNKPIITESNS